MDGLPKGPISSLLRLQRWQQAQHDTALVQGRALPSQQAPATDLSATTSLCSLPLSLPQGTAKLGRHHHVQAQPGTLTHAHPPRTLPWALWSCFGNAPMPGMAKLHTSPSLEGSAISCGQCWSPAQRTVQEFQNAKRPEQGRRQILEASLVLPFTCGDKPTTHPFSTATNQP